MRTQQTDPWKWRNRAYDNLILVAFLNIEGTFNNVKPDLSTTRCISELLNKMTIKTKIGSSKQGHTTGWCPFTTTTTNKVGSTRINDYDVAVAISSFHLNTLSSRLEIVP